MATFMGTQGWQRYAALKTQGYSHSGGKSNMQRGEQTAESPVDTVIPDTAGEGNSRNCRGLIDLLCA